jgi:hypothetical protein
VIQTMFMIRNAQLAALANDFRIRFEERLREELREAFPKVVEPMPRPAFEKRVHDAVDRALAHGLTDEADARVYVRLSFEHGESFETRGEFAPVHSVLRVASLPGWVKMDFLREFLQTHDVRGGPNSNR